MKPIPSAHFIACRTCLRGNAVRSLYEWKGIVGSAAAAVPVVAADKKMKEFCRVNEVFIP
jgi:hypothetical protein